MAALADDDYTRALEALGDRLPRPRAVLCVSAHWEAPAPVRVTAGPRPSTIHDFWGFPDALYRITYPAPGAPDVAAEVVAALGEAGIAAEPDGVRGFDHGVWVPLRRIYPRADVPVVAASLPAGAPPRDLLALGRALAPLRTRGILLVGSGGVVHNLGRLGPDGAPVAAWARAFDDWVRARLAAADLESLARYREEAPHASLAAPTTEHFDPLLVVAGSTDARDHVADVFAGFQHGTLSLRCLTFEPQGG
jgi:4,5-DOPA dioxygenase extradiol